MPNTSQNHYLSEKGENFFTYIDYFLNFQQYMLKTTSQQNKQFKSSQNS